MPEIISQLVRHLLVEGRVQGVGFRWFTRERARRQGLRGWVQNRSDGSVEVFVSGSQQALDRLAADLAIGPRGAHVERVVDIASDGKQELPFPFAIHR
jgi:acylphosphatase